MERGERQVKFGKGDKKIKIKIISKIRNKENSYLSNFKRYLDSLKLSAISGRGKARRRLKLKITFANLTTMLKEMK